MSRPRRIVADGVEQGGVLVDTGSKAHIRWCVRGPRNGSSPPSPGCRPSGAGPGRGQPVRRVVPGARLVRAVWDLDREQRAKEWATPAAAFAKRLDEALADEAPLTDAERRAARRAGGRAGHAPVSTRGRSSVKGCNPCSAPSVSTSPTPSPRCAAPPPRGRARLRRAGRHPPARQGRRHRWSADPRDRRNVARAADVPVFYVRHVSLPPTHLGVGALRTAMAWQTEGPGAGRDHRLPAGRPAHGDHRRARAGGRRAGVRQARHVRPRRHAARGRRCATAASPRCSSSWSSSRSASSRPPGTPRIWASSRWWWTTRAGSSSRRPRSVRSTRWTTR